MTKQVDLIIRLSDPIILRDGRPFGQAGVAQTGTLNWPRPGTIIGMVRNYIGRMRQADFFINDREKHIEEIKKVEVKRLHPVITEQSHLTVGLPAPADAVAFRVNDSDDESPLMIKCAVPESLSSDEGGDLSFPDWLYPFVHEQKKPAEMPLFWRWDHLKTWLIGSDVKVPAEGIKPESLGIIKPPVEERTHVSIDSQTGASEDAKLFTTTGVRFSHNISIAARFSIGENDSLPERDMTVLGGDRRPVYLEWKDNLIDWPELPEKVGRSGGLRLILTSPGVFRCGWLPEWLNPCIEKGEWVTIPDTDISVRLRSACIPRWQALHGWDMSIGKYGAPKPMRKMTQAGAVYFIELKEPEKARQAAQILWGTSLCENEQDRRDGFGRIIVGNWNTLKQ